MSPHNLLPNLRSRVARHVLLPLAIMWLAGTAITAQVAYYYAEQAFDRALLDDAYALAANVQSDPLGIQLKLTDQEIKTLLFDQSEQVYMAVLRSDGSLVGGHPWLRVGPLPPDKNYAFSDGTYQGKSLRVVSVYYDNAPSGYRVVMAQTTRSRTELLQKVLLFAFVPQAALLTFLAWWLRRVIGADLQPLADLQHALNQRDANDLAPLVVQASSRDVQQLGGAINALMARVERGVRAQREFSGNVAHELRTPLAGIRALATYGLAQTDPHVWQQQLQAIVSSEARASHMVEQLLAMALADETRDSLRLHPVALDAVVRRVLLSALPLADAAGVDLGACGIDEPVSVIGDESLIEGILNNLLDNALRYGKPVAGTAPRVTVDLRSSTDTVSLWVIDNGPGIAEDKREDLLQRWQQAGSEGESPVGKGVGLGLAIVTRYAALLGVRFMFGANEGTTASDDGFAAGLQWQGNGR